MKQLEPKLDALARCLLRIESKKPFTVEQLKSDFDLQDIVSINLERSVQQSVDIASVILAETNEPAPLTMADSFAKLSAIGWISQPVALRMRIEVAVRALLQAPRDVDVERERREGGEARRAGVGADGDGLR